MRRAWVASLAVVGVGALVGLPAMAAEEDADVTISTVPNQNAWDKPNITVQPGETVTWTNPTTSGRNHDLAFGPEPNPVPAVTPASQGWTYSRTFTEAEAGMTIRFVCILHKTRTPPMEGTVTVAGGTPTPTPTPTPTETPSPTPSPTPAPTAPPPPPPAATPTPAPTTTPARRPRIRSLSARGRFCARRSRRCRRPGVTLRINLSETATVTGTLDRQARRSKRFRRFARVRLGRLPAGARRVRLKLTGRKRIAAGRYRLRLKAGTSSKTVIFRVR